MYVQLLTFVGVAMMLPALKSMAVAPSPLLASSSFLAWRWPMLLTGVWIISIAHEVLVPAQALWIPFFWLGSWVLLQIGNRRHAAER